MVRIAKSGRHVVGVGVALSIALTVVRPQAREGELGAAVRLELAGDGLVAVKATINGAGPFRLLLDTGATRSAVSAHVASSLGLTPVATATAVTPAGSRTTTLVRLNDLTVGSVTKPAVVAVLLDDAWCKALAAPEGGRIDGVVGQDFLMGETYTLDYERYRLIWGGDQTPARRGIARLVLREREGRWLAALPQNGRDAETSWLVPDSGAASVVVFDRGRTAPFPLSAVPSSVRLRTVFGNQRAGLALIERLVIGPIVIRDVQAAVVDRRELDAPEGDGLLPLALFAAATFDKAGYLTLRPR